jgi:hypothetical protein
MKHFTTPCVSGPVRNPHGADTPVPMVTPANKRLPSRALPEPVSELPPSDGKPMRGPWPMDSVDLGSGKARPTASGDSSKAQPR